MIKPDRFFSKDYLLSTNENFSNWYIYLPFFVIMVFLAIFVGIILRRRDDYPAKRLFERQFFWIYIIFGFSGLVSVFSRMQNLPVFGNRLITFIILGLFLGFNIYLFVYYIKVTKKENLKFAQKKRKEKWLKKK